MKVQSLTWKYRCCKHISCCFLKTIEAIKKAFSGFFVIFIKLIRFNLKVTWIVPLHFYMRLQTAMVMVKDVNFRPWEQKLAFYTEEDAPPEMHSAQKLKWIGTWQ